MTSGRIARLAHQAKGNPAWGVHGFAEHSHASEPLVDVGRRTLSPTPRSGGSLPILTILDEYARECHVLQMDRALAT